MSARAKRPRLGRRAADDLRPLVEHVLQEDLGELPDRPTVSVQRRNGGSGEECHLLPLPVVRDAREPELVAQELDCLDERVVVTLRRRGETESQGSVDRCALELIPGHRLDARLVPFVFVTLELLGHVVSLESLGACEFGTQAPAHVMVVAEPEHQLAVEAFGACVLPRAVVTIDVGVIPAGLKQRGTDVVH